MGSEIAETGDRRPDNIIAAWFDTTRRLEYFAETLREGERVCRSPHPPQAVPLPRKDSEELGVRSEELGVRSEELLRSLFEDTLHLSGAPIDY